METSADKGVYGLVNGQPQHVLKAGLPPLHQLGVCRLLGVGGEGEDAHGEEKHHKNSEDSARTLLSHKPPPLSRTLLVYTFII